MDNKTNTNAKKMNWNNIKIILTFIAIKHSPHGYPCVCVGEDIPSPDGDLACDVSKVNDTDKNGHKGW